MTNPPVNRRRLATTPVVSAPIAGPATRRSGAGRTGQTGTRLQQPRARRSRSLWPGTQTVTVAFLVLVAIGWLATSVYLIGLLR